MYRFCPIVALVLAASVCQPLFAVEIKGTVVEAEAGIVKIQTDSEIVPDLGDKVEIGAPIPGLDELALVADGTVQLDRCQDGPLARPSYQRSGRHHCF
jgi:hypothetical protein